MAEDSSKKRFVQVARSTADDLLDPLSQFLSIEAQNPPPPEPEVEKSISSNYVDLGEPLRTPKFQDRPTSSTVVTGILQPPQQQQSELVQPPPVPASPARINHAPVYQQGRPLAETASSTPTSNGRITAIRDDSLDLEGISITMLTGESVVMTLKSAYILINGRMVSGTFFMTNYKVSFAPSSMNLAMLASTNPTIYSWLSIPLACIEKIEKEKRANPRDYRMSTITIVISTKDIRQHRISLQGKPTEEYEVDRAINVMNMYAFPNNIKHCFAFSHALPSEPLSIARVPLYDAVTEFSRQGIFLGDNNLWRISNANRAFRLCNSYPSSLVVPQSVSDEELFQVASFRSGQRLPVLCWGDRESGASIWRSSQPKAGMSGSNAYDERFLNIVALSCTRKRNPLGVTRVVSEPVLHIVDCRPRASAMANRAAGAGYESQSNYPNCRLEFYNIGNIHVMRDSLKTLVGTIMNPNPGSNDLYFSKQIEDSQWLTHVRLVLKASLETAQFIRKGTPVLVHCSHGWDRTAQVCALAELFLDSYYRTMDGFKILVEKEFISFGHQFQMRCGHMQDKATRQEDQMSPIFLQFLDAVWQLVKQYPHYFEFNARYLLTIADHIYSCRFGTFIMSCDMDREMNHVAERCLDLWTYLHYNRHNFLNPLFMDPNNENTPTTHVLIPPMSQMLRNVTLWTDYYLRWSPVQSILSPPEPVYKFLMDNGISNPVAATGEVEEMEMSRTVSDLVLPAMVTSDDFWEGMYREQKGLAESRRVAQSSESGVTEETTSASEDTSNNHNATGNKDFESEAKEKHSKLADMLQAKDYIIECQQEIIDRLSSMLRNAGLDEEAINSAISSATNNLQDVPPSLIRPVSAENLPSYKSWTDEIGEMAPTPNSFDDNMVATPTIGDGDSSDPADPNNLSLLL